MTNSQFTKFINSLKKISLILFVSSVLLSACSSDNERDKKPKEPEPTFLDPQLKALKDAKKIEAELLERDKEMKKKIEDASKSQQDDDTY